MLKPILISIIVFYLFLLCTAYFFSDMVIFIPPPPGYSDNNEIIKLSMGTNGTISAIYLPNKNAKYTILISHGNAEDLGYMYPFLKQMQEHGLAVFAYDYSGYGTSDGKPTEHATYQNIDAAYNYLTQQLKVNPLHIIAYGRSVGAAVALDLAIRKPIAGLIMESPFVTAFRVVTHFPLLPFDKFDNLTKIKNLNIPLLIIHGTKDNIVPIWQSKKLYATATTTKQFFAVANAGHNDILWVAQDAYWDKIKNFITSLKN